MDLRLNDIVRMKKPHPCGSYEWKLLRVGIDFRMQCEGCGHTIMLPRTQVEKRIRKLFRDGAEIPVERN
ncbi:MAG: DUF951 domain-containing protein [Lachnospiraceae bacterium]|nr:DUF951 domain-containing protein [Lachnospiraceae bacterium]